MGTDSWIQADALDDSFRVKAFHLSVGVEFIKVAHSQGEIGVCEEFDGFGLGGTDEKYGNSFGIRMR